MVRAIWKANLVVGPERVPVKLYSAAKDGGVRFHLLHAKDGARVRQRMAHPRTGETVAMEDVRRGVEVGRGRFVVLDEEELASLEPEGSRDVAIERFVPPAAIDPRWYERPYYLGPDEGEDDRYWALASAIEASGLEGLARWTLRKRAYTGALLLHEGLLALVALRAAQELLPVANLRAPAGRELDPRELALATQLVEALGGEFDPGAYRDEYRERVLALIEAKRKGKVIRLERFRPRAVTDDTLLESLQASLRRAG